MEEVLFEHESKQTRADVAALLRDVAEKLESGEPVTLSAGERSIALDVPAQPTFEVKAEREVNGNEELSVEFELEWTVGQEESDTPLSVE
jgi:amphi-Trp domain-containing protein